MNGQYPLVPKNPGEFYLGSIRFSDEALGLICCCALFTNLTPLTVARVFRGEHRGNNSYSQITNNNDLSNVQDSEVRDCFFKMLDDHHPIYQRWVRTHPVHPLTNRLAIDRTLAPIEDAGVDYKLTYKWDQGKQTLRPNWLTGYYAAEMV